MAGSGHQYGSVNMSGDARLQQGNSYNFAFAPRAPPPRPRLTIPIARDSHFVGRQDILDDLETRLKVPGYHNRVTLTGLGGVGKSQIAIEYGHLYSQKRPDHWVFWVYAASQDRFAQSYSKIAVHLGLLRPGETNANAVELVSQWLSDPNNGPWLMIVDNADDNEVFFQATDGQRPLVDKIPQCSHGAVLVTSRTQTGVDIAMEPENEIHVRAFDEATSLQLLSKKLGKTLDNHDEARELASELEHLALALTQAARYICSTKQSITYYLQLFRQEERRQVELLGKEWRDLRRDTSVSNAVLTSWRITWDHLRRECYLAAQLLARMSLLDRQRIPPFLVLNFKNRKDELPDQRRLEAMGMLLQYGLCWASGETTHSGYSMHRLVQVCTKAWLRESGKLPAWERHVVAIVGRFAPNVRLGTALETHARAVLPYIMTYGKPGHQSIYAILMRAAIMDGRLDRQIELLDQTIAFCRFLGISQPWIFELMLIKAQRRLEYDPSSVTLAELENLRVDYAHTGGYEGEGRIRLEVLIIEKRFPRDEEAIAAFEALLEIEKDQPPNRTTNANATLLSGRLFRRCAVARQFGRAREALSSARKIADRAFEPDDELERTLRLHEAQLLAICGERHEERALLSYVTTIGSPASGRDFLRAIYVVVFYIRWNEYETAETLFNTLPGIPGQKRSGAKTLLPCVALRIADNIASNPRAYLQKIWDRWAMAFGMSCFDELWHAYTTGVGHGVDWRGDFWLGFIKTPGKPWPLDGAEF